jgi:hypothetical protein
VDDKTVHDSFPESERAKERETVLNSLVADVRVATSEPAQVLVRSPELFCGAANCTLWLFVRESGHLRLILETTGTGLEIRSAITKGFHDLSSGIHISAFEQDYTIYRWEGRKYNPIDSYACMFDRKDPEKLLPGVDVRCHEPHTAVLEDKADHAALSDTAFGPLFACSVLRTDTVSVTASARHASHATARLESGPPTSDT